MFWDILGWVLASIGGLAILAAIAFVVILVIISNSPDNPFR